MDYMFDFYFEQNNSNQNIQSPYFLYDDHRFFSKMYVFLKFFGILLYGITLFSCNDIDFFIIIIVFMSLSMINSFRYEYAHYKKYRTIFPSINDFIIWKKNLYPKSRIFFSSIEAIIKILFFIKTFPPRFYFNNLCEIGDTFLKIHILALFIIYIIIGVFSMCLLWTIHCYDSSYHESDIQRAEITLPIPILIINQNEECCICLDNDNILLWIILPCGHKFHQQCILTWLRNNHTCPICRLNISYHN